MRGKAIYDRDAANLTTTAYCSLCQIELRFGFLVMTCGYGYQTCMLLLTSYLSIVSAKSRLVSERVLISKCCCKRFLPYLFRLP